MILSDDKNNEDNNQDPGHTKIGLGDRIQLFCVDYTNKKVK